MRPNTLVLGFYDDCTPHDHLQGHILLSTGHSFDTVCPTKVPGEQRSPFFPSLRGAEDPKDLQEEEYVSVIADAVKMGKNVTLARCFDQFNRDRVLGSGRKIRGVAGPFIDVWPMNLLQPDSHSYVGICSLFLLQLACVLHDSRAWNQARLRLFLCMEAGYSLQEKEEAKLQGMLRDLRISAQVQMVAWDEVVALHWQRQRERAEQNEEDEREKTVTRHIPIMPLNLQMSTSVPSMIWFAVMVSLSQLCVSCICHTPQLIEAVTVPTCIRWTCWVETLVRHCSFTESLLWLRLTSRILLTLCHRLAESSIVHGRGCACCLPIYWHVSRQPQYYNRWKHCKSQF